MTIAKTFGFCLLIGVGGISASSAYADPVRPPQVLYKPNFLLLDDSWTAGTGFIVRLKQPGLFFITANHLFGPDAGLKSQMPPDDIARDVKGVVGLSMQKTSETIWFPEFIKIADADSVESQAYAKDIAVFRRNDMPDIQALEFAEDMPKKGDRVWVFARQRGDDVPGLLAATVEEASDTALIYVFDKSDFRLAGTSGAPVLNEAGKVVGINLAGGLMPDKQFKGWANPVSAIRQELAKALPEKP